MTSTDPSLESQLMIDWIIDNEPMILVEVSKFWLFNCFSQTPADYEKELSFILSTLDSNFNIIIYDD
jgi:hypothetical protein